MAKYTVLDFCLDVLREPKTPLLYQEIWNIGKDSQYGRKLELKSKTPEQTIGAALYMDVRDNPNSPFVKIGKQPSRFFLKERLNELPSNIENFLLKEKSQPVLPTVKEYKERDLHPIVTYYAYANAEFNRGKAIYTKTIYHETSKKVRLSQWIHPDIVGFYIPIEDWNQSLLEFNKISDANSIKLFSFEVKVEINRANYREYFFQTVSNSSWAHESYLVTAQLYQDDDLLAELERLSSSFGIGLIVLDIKDIDSSKVLFPAKSRNKLDWEVMNKLCEENSDFRKFIDDVRKDYEVKTIHKSEYDKILENPQEYIDKLRGKFYKNSLS